MNMYRTADFAFLSETKAIKLPVGMADVESDLSRIFPLSDRRRVRVPPAAVRSTPLGSVRAAVPIGVAAVLGAAALGFALYPYEQQHPVGAVQETVEVHGAVAVADVSMAPVASRSKEPKQVAAASSGKSDPRPVTVKRETPAIKIAARSPVSVIAKPKPEEKFKPAFQPDGLPIGTSGKAIRLHGEALRLAFEADAKLTRDANAARERASTALASQNPPQMQNK